MNFFQPIILFYNDTLKILFNNDTLNSFPKDLFIIILIVIGLFLLLLLLKVVKFKKNKKYYDKEKNSIYLLEIEKKLKALKELYIQGHIDAKTYKEKAIEITNVNLEK